MSKGIPDEL
jgi:hypothetical protein